MTTTLSRIAIGVVLVVAPRPGLAQLGLVLEDFEFASSDEAAAAGVIDLTDLANSPAFYISGADENASEGLFSIGTDAVFCQISCVPGSFIGFRRLLSVQRFPQVCPGGEHYAPLTHTYGDPDNPGPLPPDFALQSLTLVTDAYGDGAFADGPSGTHLWINLVDCEGEVFEFINHSESSLYSEFWTFNVEMGRSIVRLSPDSLVEIPDGDRLLTEVAAIEVLIQDADDPPTTVGKWYVDHLRLLEPGALAASGAASRYLAVTPGAAESAIALLVEGDGVDPDIGCLSAYVQADGTLGPQAVFQAPESWGSLTVRGLDVRPDSVYDVRVDSGTPGNPQLSEAITVSTPPFGEIDGSLGVTIDDLACVVDAFEGVFLDCAFIASDIGPCDTDGRIDLDDLLHASDALLAQPFPCDPRCDP